MPGIQDIQSQAEHHRKMAFQEEFLALLKKHRIAYDEWYLGVNVSRPCGT